MDNNPFISDEKLEANRANSQHSTGPRTVAGKQRSAANAIKHGLSGRTLVVRDDEKEEHAAFLAKWEKDMQPKDAAEEEVFGQLITAAWQLRRLSRVEAEMISQSLDDPLHSENEAIQKKLALNSIYQSRAERAFHKALAELRRLQEERFFREAHATLHSTSLPKLPRLGRIRRELDADKRTQNKANLQAFKDFLNEPPPRQA